MFSRLARRYDLNNRLFSAGRDQAWRRATIAAAAIRSGERVLDVACGTGDLAAMACSKAPSRVVALDFCPEMLAVARRRFPDLPVEWLQADALAMPLPDESFDVLTCGFGLRNMADVAAALSEFRRVLAPKGRCVILEFHSSRPRGLRRLGRWYTDVIMPALASLVARDGVGAYRYLRSSSEAFGPPEDLSRRLLEAGFADAAFKRTALGLAALHVALR